MDKDISVVSAVLTRLISTIYAGAQANATVDEELGQAFSESSYKGERWKDGVMPPQRLRGLRRFRAMHRLRCKPSIGNQAMTLIRPSETHEYPRQGVQYY